MGATVRPARRAGSWYPGSEARCRAELLRLAAARAPLAEPRGEILAAVAPHAGWSFSGATAALVYAALARMTTPPETLLVFGAVHVLGVARPSVWPDGAWATPLGPVAIDAELAAALLADEPRLFRADPEAHAEEHAIEILVPFVRHFLPAARIVPVAVPVTGAAEPAGAAAARAVERLGRRAVAVASSDLTHYGESFYGFAPRGRGAAALAWVREENDREMIERVLALDAAGVLASAEARRNACGAGAVAAAVSFARARGATGGTLLDYATSYEIEARPGPPSDFVGYAGIVLERAPRAG